MKKFDELGTRTRFIKEINTIRDKYTLTEMEFALSIGIKSTRAKQIITDLKKGDRRISLDIIQNTFNKYPEFNRTYVLDSDEIPKVEVFSLRGADREQKAGRKRTRPEEVKRYSYYEKKHQPKSSGVDDSPGGE